MSIGDRLRAQLGSRWRESEPLARHTNIRIGGPSQYFATVHNVAELREVIAAGDLFGLAWRILGGGSNALTADEGVNGITIQMANRDIHVETDQRSVVAEAGAITASVARKASRAGLTGMEWAVSLPGTIGGAVRGNAGCFGSETRDILDSVRVLDASQETRPVIELNADACAFDYRHSIFKLKPDWVVVDATFRLQVGDAKQSEQMIQSVLAQRSSEQPSNRPSAGCMFKNVSVDGLTRHTRARLDELANGTWGDVVRNNFLPAGWIVDQLGMKGHRVGQVMISEQHGNFLANLGGATADEIRTVLHNVRERAREALGIDLELEVQLWGWEE
jgi:UDP-N-acetylmuramate dehydrogenase